MIILRSFQEVSLKEKDEQKSLKSDVVSQLTDATQPFVAIDCQKTQILY